MIKNTGKIIYIIALITAFFDACKYRPQPKKMTDDLTVGDVFEIRIRENQSTGYEMCWMNKKEIHSVAFIKKEYHYSNPDCMGCAGVAVFTFKAVAPGKDTIKLANCPTIRQGKNCEEVSIEERTEVQNFVALIN